MGSWGTAASPAPRGAQSGRPRGAMAKEIPGRRRATLGADKHYDDRDFVECVRTLNVTPHIAQKELTALDARTTRHSGYGVSQRFRKRVEEVFGWLKTV